MTNWMSCDQVLRIQLSYSSVIPGIVQAIAEILSTLQLYALLSLINFAAHRALQVKTRPGYVEVQSGYMSETHGCVASYLGYGHCVFAVNYLESPGVPMGKSNLDCSNGLDGTL
jgi:hypothetical protein